MAQFHEITYQLSCPFSLRKMIDFVVESLRKITWPDPGHQQTAKTFFEKIDYQKGYIQIRRKDPHGKPLQNPFLTQEKITVWVKPQADDRYQIKIRSESLVTLPLGHNYDNAIAIKKAILRQQHTLKSSQSAAKTRPPSPRSVSRPHASPANPYQILDVPPQATPQQITEAYLRAVRANHPDQLAGMAPELRQLAEERMKLINAAYDHLKHLKRSR